MKIYSPQIIGDTTLTGSLDVTSNVTASNLLVTGLATLASASITYLETIYETASVIYSSGSNQFGDASNDVQTMYGTVDLKNGPLRVSGSTILSGSTDIQGGDFKVTDQAHNAEFDVDYFKVQTLSGAQFTGSVISTGGFTGSLQGTASYAITADTASAVSTTPANDGTAYDLVFVASQAAGTQAVRTDDNGNITFNPSTGTLTVPTLSGNATSATSASYAVSASLATSASYYPIATSFATAGFTGSTWTFNHNLNNDYVVIDCYDSNNEEIIPSTIDLVSANQASITFPVSVQGTAVATLANGFNNVSLSQSITNNTYINTSPVNTLSTNAGLTTTASAYVQKLDITATGTYNIHISQSGPYWVDCSGLASGTSANLNIYMWTDTLASLPANSGSTVMFSAAAGSGTYLTYRTIATGSVQFWSATTTVGGTSTTISRNATLARRDFGSGVGNPNSVVKYADGSLVFTPPAGNNAFPTVLYSFTGNQGTPIP